MSWVEDKMAADRYMPQVKQICGNSLIMEAPADEDALHNTDLIVVGMSALRIAVRIRDAKYMAEYANEFTIRTSRPSGKQSELAKLMSGYGDLFFYGFARGDRLVGWRLADLKIFRLECFRFMQANNGALPGQARGNNDESSMFAAFKWADFPPEMIVNQWVPDVPF